MNCDRLAALVARRLMMLGTWHPWTEPRQGAFCVVKAATVHRGEPFILAYEFSDVDTDAYAEEAAREMHRKLTKASETP